MDLGAVRAQERSRVIDRLHAVIVTSHDVRALDLKLASRRQELEQELRQGQPQLYALRAEAEQKRSALTPQFLRLAQTLEQAKANAKVA